MHLPFELQALGATHSGSSVPLLIEVHIPDGAQLLQGWLQALLQQTPSLQNPLEHSPAPEQLTPSPLPGEISRPAE